jgi:hypothetical protein
MQVTGKIVGGKIMFFATHDFAPSLEPGTRDARKGLCHKTTNKNTQRIEAVIFAVFRGQTFPISPSVPIHVIRG